MKGQDMQEA